METKTIQITSGRGPAECCWVVAQVLKIFIRTLKEGQLAYTILQKEQGVENRTLQSVTVQIEGKALEQFLKPWIGTIQWIGISSFRPQHKRKNWFVGLYEIEENQEFQLDEKDIVYQATRSSGPGGQHVNKVSSAIRAIHQPSNIQVLVMDRRSQHQNKKIAKQRLQDKVAEMQLQTLKDTVKHQWENHLQLERGNPVKVFTGSDFKVQKKE
ncbi:peptide chain release factor H [Winogradskyella sp. SYSU M77433]|uniref:peptide chain release factor H n=1 Tax=Winogradskyella sp. SYSU M77433 TaxID=3042722 RepID=UPI00247FBC4D|nr:peptide chain release factor H [Winogradskyella sp. SYSU M77433]MDH7913811.1 peptide chain release factor H [Winogradskyella sp. SYSU M77433]